GKDGFDVLRWVRQQPTLSALRIVVLTSSAEIRDVNLAYRLGANSFLVKPVDFQDFIQLSHFLKNYWLLFTKTPEISRPLPPPAGVATSPREVRLSASTLTTEILFWLLPQ